MSNNRGRERRQHDRYRTIGLGVWLAVITALVAWGLISLQHQQDHLQAQVHVFKTGRIEATQQRCDLDRILLGLISTAKVDYLAQPLRANLADCQALLGTYRGQK
jgi:hypothetical protein